MRKIVFLYLIVVLLGGSYVVADAGIIDDLREKITSRNNEIKDLEREIDEYKNQLEVLGGQTTTLNSAIKTLDLTQKKLDIDIQVTGKKINGTLLTIDSLYYEIEETKEKITHGTHTLRELIRTLYDLESRSFVEILLANRSFSSFWSSLEGYERFQKGVGENVASLSSLKLSLEKKKNDSENEKNRLTALKGQFSDQKEIVNQNKTEKQVLLQETKSKEANYKSLLEDRLAQKEALEKEINEYEAQLKFELDPSSLPPTGSGALNWPLQNIRITQYFGNTPFATQNPQVYNGGGHNGIDLGASIGTPVYASANGVVVDTGDTDTQCYKVSYGKWILVRHNNGLSTLYAHLSLVSVSPGQEVGSGSVIGYSGSTGYSTGPHLHYAVFASQAVEVTSEYRSRVCGTYLKLPLSARSGYLNPLSYLPTP